MQHKCSAVYLYGTNVSLWLSLNGIILLNCSKSPDNTKFGNKEASTSILMNNSLYLHSCRE